MTGDSATAVQRPEAAAGPWGSDGSGLIVGYRFRGGHAEAIDSLQAARLLAIPPEPTGAQQHGFLWLHFNFAQPGAQRWLERHAPMEPAFFEMLGENLRSTRVERAENSLIAVVNDVHFDFDFDASDISTLWISLDQSLVVTGRHQPLRSVDALRMRVKHGESIGSSSELLERLLRDQADVLLGIVRTVTRRVDKVEDDLLGGLSGAQRARLGSMRRLLVRLQRLLAPEPASLFRLLQHPPLWMSEADVLGLRQASEEFSVVLSDMASLQERIKLLQEEIAAAVNEANGRSLFLLTVFTVLALPINILAGLFGMNVGEIPMAQEPWGFWIIVSIVLTFTLLAGWWALRRAVGKR